MTKIDINTKIKLNNGVEMPVLGFGTYKIQDGEEAFNSVTLALGAGYRSIDTATKYQNEAGVGKAINKYGLLREEVFVTTKLWNTDQGYEQTLKAIDISLNKLGLAYVDLYLVHWPTANNDEKISLDKREETWKAMEEIYSSGRARAIGVSNYTITHLEDMRRYANIMPAVNQVEFHPFLVQEKLQKYCKDNNIALEAYGSLVKAKRLEDPRILAVANKHKKSSAQILLRWNLQHGNIVLTKSTHKEHIFENINIFDFELDSIDMKNLDALDENMRMFGDPTELL